MASFTFNSVDLSDYDLSVISSNFFEFSQSLPYTQLQDYALIGGYKRNALGLKMNVVIQGTNAADVISNLDNVKKTLVGEDEEQLILDSVNTRYWNARLESLDGEFVSNTIWQGTLTFLCPDPLAYSTTETSSDFNIDADPDTISETMDGTAITKPVWTLTAGETLTDVTIKLENVITGEELQWTGSLVDEDELEIDSANWTVKLNGTSAMTITGEFPRLQPGSNTIKVTAFSTTGTLNITYRDAYL
ncbi:MAG: phage tail family protein [Dehalococcoidales bacterium]|nr:phage tail family protein [Dehalococcoidales bacterium]